jgi:Transposase DDE domain group 1
MASSHVLLDQVDIAFDDERAVASAGLLLPATLAERLGIEQAADQLVDLGDRPGAARPGRKLLTLVHALVAGGDCIDDVELLRCGSTASVLGHRVMAASTVGTWLRSFTFGHVRQLDRVTGEILSRAWAAGAGPDDGPLTVDVDSTICEVHGYHKQGACYGYTHRLGYHPLLATRAGSGEVLHARLRKGSANTARGIVRFVDELVARCRRAGASGELTFRMDSGFWSAKLIKRLRRHRVRYSITVRQTKTVRAAIAAIPEAAWAPIAYQPDGVAQVAETPYRGDRLIVRRVRNLDDQQQLFPTWRYHAFVTNRVGTTTWLDADHRRHAVCELAIRDLKAGAGLAHLPSGRFAANAAWLLAATLAHNLLRWTASLGLGYRDQQTVAKTLRRTLLALPGRLTRSPPADPASARRLAVGPLVRHGAGSAALHPVPDLTAPRPRLGLSAAANCSRLPVTASEGSPGCTTTSSRLSPATSCGSAVTQRERPHATPGAASGNQPPHSRIGGSRLSSPRWRSLDLPGDGHEDSLRGREISKDDHQASGITPLPAVAWARRTLSPWVAQRWAWCSSRSTVAVARVLGMISSKPAGWRLELTATERFS